MIVSNEPGYYKTGAYGIRVENLVTVVAVPRPADADRDFLGFETLTLCPIDLALVDPAMLSAGEIAWLDAYHASVRATISPLVDAATKQWIEGATRKLAG
jgi:Xaa-Pro aminopeptidase